MRVWISLHHGVVKTHGVVIGLKEDRYHNFPWKTLTKVIVFLIYKCCSMNELYTLSQHQVHPPKWFLPVEAVNKSLSFLLSYSSGPTTPFSPQLWRRGQLLSRFYSLFPVIYVRVCLSRATDTACMSQMTLTGDCGEGEANDLSVIRVGRRKKVWPSPSIAAALELISMTQLTSLHCTAPKTRSRSMPLAYSPNTLSFQPKKTKHTSQNLISHYS
jgi:hypothetical protein